MVYKLVAHRDAAGDWVNVAKKSAAKATVGGRKYPVRSLHGSGIARAETIYVDSAPTPRPAERPLLVPLLTAGEVDARYTGPDGTALAREHHEQAIAELPDDAFRLSRGDPAIPTVYA
jgi:nicotinate phosphoribosyltransferase